MGFPATSKLLIDYPSGTRCGLTVGTFYTEFWSVLQGELIELEPDASPAGVKIDYSS